MREIYTTMLYRDVDRSLGYMLSVSMVQSHPLIPVMEKELGEVPLHTDRIGEESYIDQFIQGEKAAKFEKLVPSYDHEMRGDLLTVKIKSAEMDIVSGMMDRILDVLSTPGRCSCGRYTVPCSTVTWTAAWATCSRSPWCRAIPSSLLWRRSSARSRSTLTA